jgi:protein SCO1/2
MQWRTRSIVTLVALVAIPAATATACASDDASPGEDRWRGARLETPVARPDFTLLDTQGESFDFRARTAGTLTFLFFGYTNCPDVCPIHMRGLGRVIARFPHDVRSRVHVVFVTTDPDRDTPDRMREWLDDMGSGFTGLRGSIDDVNAIQTGLGLPPAVAAWPAADSTAYAVGHAAQVLAFTPDDSAHFAYPFGTREQDWMHDLPRLLRLSGNR